MLFSLGIKMLTGPSDAVRFIVCRDLSASLDLKASKKFKQNDKELQSVNLWHV